MGKIVEFKSKGKRTELNVGGPTLNTTVLFKNAYEEDLLQDFVLIGRSVSEDEIVAVQCDTASLVRAMDNLLDTLYHHEWTQEETGDLLHRLELIENRIKGIKRDKEVWT